MGLRGGLMSRDEQWLDFVQMSALGFLLRGFLCPRI